MQIVRKIEPIPKLERKLKVCAYARVSTGKDAMLHSLSSQISFYNKKISSNSNYIFVGVYSDEAITGTKEDRAGFQKMLTACRNGEIDLIITKSISRFARNTVTLLQTVRELKSIGVDVFFEEQNLHTISEDGELVLTLLALFAEQEAYSMSENMKWRVKKNFEQGLVWGRAPYGYRIENGRFIVESSEAPAIKLIFQMYLAGHTVGEIAKTLDAKGFKPKMTKTWSRSYIRVMLKQYIYTGNVILQRTYSDNFLTKKTVINKGEKPKYLVEDSHEALVSMEDFLRVQEIMKSRLESYVYDPKESPFKGKLVCGCCGGKYQLKKNYKKLVWICHTYLAYGVNKCTSKRVPNDELVRVAKEILNVEVLTDEAVETIEKIIVSNGRLLTFYFKDGHTVDATWIEHSRSESWTPEMRENARIKELERHGKSNSHTTKD